MEEYFKILVQVVAGTFISGLVALVGMFHKLKNLNAKVEKLEKESRENRRLVWDTVNQLKLETNTVSTTLSGIQGTVEDIKNGILRIEEKIFK